MPHTLVAVYRRTVAASLARVWENVLDWEHLPWLHRDTFAHVRLLAADADGWRAETAMRDDPRRRPSLLAVTLERDALRYHARTVEGPGAGTDIVTTLAPIGPEATDIHVAFDVPGVAAADAARVGAYYRALYTRLWDEDEAMMVRRQAVLDGRLGCPARTVVVGGERVRFGTVCPHRGGPLDAAPVEDGCVVCPWHGWRIDARTGRVVGRP